MLVSPPPSSGALDLFAGELRRELRYSQALLLLRRLIEREPGSAAPVEIVTPEMALALIAARADVTRAIASLLDGSVARQRALEAFTGQAVPR